MDQEFLRKRIKEQDAYMLSVLISNKELDRKRELFDSAFGVKIYLQSKLKQLLNGKS